MELVNDSHNLFYKKKEEKGFIITHLFTPHMILMVCVMSLDENFLLPLKMCALESMCAYFTRLADGKHFFFFTKTFGYF